MSTHTTVIYHANCADGFGAAWAAWRALGDEGVEYVRRAYGDPLPDGLDGQTVYVLDFSFARAALDELATRAARIILLDHHKTAAEALEGAPYAHVDQTKSGAVLAWEHFHPTVEVPKLLQYVQDRDLWRWELYCSRDANEVIGGAQKTFQVWNDLATGFEGEKTFREILISGATMRATRQRMIERDCGRASVVKLDGATIAFVTSTPTYASDLGHALLERHQEAGLSLVLFHDGRGRLAASLRSRDGGDVDVAEIARRHGGGGHRNAAGFSIPLSAGAVVAALFGGVL